MKTYKVFFGAIPDIVGATDDNEETIEVELNMNFYARSIKDAVNIIKQNTNISFDIFTFNFGNKHYTEEDEKISKLFNED